MKVRLLSTDGSARLTFQSKKKKKLDLDQDLILFEHLLTKARDVCQNLAIVPMALYFIRLRFFLFVFCVCVSLFLFIFSELLSAPTGGETIKTSSHETTNKKTNKKTKDRQLCTHAATR